MSDQTEVDAGAGSRWHSPATIAAAVDAAVRKCVAGLTGYGHEAGLEIVGDLTAVVRPAGSDAPGFSMLVAIGGGLSPEPAGQALRVL